MYDFAKTMLLLCTAAQAGSMTGVGGNVRVSPAHPGPQRIGESAYRPLSGAAVQVRDTTGKIVARGVADANGHFQIAVPKGEYSVTVDVGNAALPRCASVDVVVRDGQLTQADLDCDSGMR